MPTHWGTCRTATYMPVRNQLVSWGGHRHLGDCNLGVCPWGGSLICRKGIKVFPRLSQGHGQARAGRACHTDPRSPSAATAVGRTRLRRENQGGTKPCPHGPFLFTGSGAAPGALPVTLLCHLAGHRTEQTTGSPEGRDCSRFSK